MNLVRCLLCDLRFLRPEDYLHPTHRCATAHHPAAAAPTSGGTSHSPSTPRRWFTRPRTDLDPQPA